MPLVVLSIVLILGALALPAPAPSPSYAYYWSDLGADYAASGDLTRARACYWRALELSGEVPQIWLRDANFHFQQGETDAALLSAARVLRKVGDYDGVLFSYFDQAALSPSRVLECIGSDRRPARAYLEYLIGAQRVVSAMEAFPRLRREGHLDDRLTASYIDLLLRQQRHEAAAQAWSAYLDTRRRDYPSRNLLFNGSFELEPSGCALDWRIHPVDAVEATFDHETAHGGSSSLRVRFLGTTNVGYAHTAQLVPVRPGGYRLTAWVKTDALTTKEGPRLEVADAEDAGRFSMTTEPFPAVRPWFPVEMRFAVPAATRLLSVRITRRVSPKFDNKIAGTIWFDEMVLQQN